MIGDTRTCATDGFLMTLAFMMALIDTRMTIRVSMLTVSFWKIIGFNLHQKMLSLVFSEEMGGILTLF